jgi:hypothetical protein
METAMIQQFINWWCDLIGIDPATIQMISGILAGAGGTMAAVYFRTTI